MTPEDEQPTSPAARTRPPRAPRSLPPSRPQPSPRPQTRRPPSRRPASRRAPSANGPCAGRDANATRGRPPRRSPPRRKPPAAKPAAPKPPPPKSRPRKPTKQPLAKRPRREPPPRLPRRRNPRRRPAAAKPARPRRRVVRAHARYVRTSARKARMVCPHLRGKSVEEARAILAFTPREAARDWSKLLESAVANAESNHELLEEDLIVREAYADEGPTIKRFRPRAMGRATPIAKRTSHLTIALATSRSRWPPTPRNERKTENDGTEGSSRGDARGLHPRLEVQLVQRAPLRRVPRRGHPCPRAHRQQARPRGAVGDHDPQGRQRTRGQHPHRPSRDRDRQVGHRSGRPPPRSAPHDQKADQGQHPRDQAPRARRQARRPVDRRAAPEPRRLPPGDEARPHQRDALRAPRA